MRMFLYYAAHSFKNQVKKLFKTWVLVFMLACCLIGVIVGVGVGMLSSSAREQAQQRPQAEAVQQSAAPDPVAAEQRKLDLLELAVGATVLLLFEITVLSADKSGAAVFLPADVNLLFPAPLKPQSVLMFRVLSQIGLQICCSLYMIFQLPNLTHNLGLSPWGAAAVLLAWGLALVYMQLLQVLLYTVGATHERLKTKLTPASFALLGLAAAAFLAYFGKSGLSPYEAAVRFFNAPASRYIPLWGWFKGLVMCAAAGRTAASLVYLALLLATGGLAIFLIWHIKADFYEDAMARSEETAAVQAAARGEGRVRRKTERGDGIRRDGMRFGAGENVFFFKALYNRFRFARFGIFTKTAVTYLCLALLTAAVAGRVAPAYAMTAAALALAAAVFFRTLKNPLTEDTDSLYFRLMPGSTYQKLLWSLLGGTAVSALDLLPAMAAAALLARANPLTALLWLLFLATVQLYSTVVGTFISSSVPVQAGLTVKQLTQILFVYFGLLPDAGLIAAGFVGAGGLSLTAALALAALVNLLIAAVFMALIPLFLDPPSRPCPPPQPLSEAGRAAARRCFSRCGLFGFLVLAVTTALQLGLSAAAKNFCPLALQSPWALWIITFAPLYLVGVPAGLAVLRRLPRAAAAPSPLPARRAAECFPAAIFFLYAGSLAGVLASLPVQLLTGGEQVNSVASYAMNGPLPLRILVMVVLAPAVEEFLFRRQLIDRMRRYGEKTAVLVSALMFGLFHGNLSQFFYAALLGLLLGYVYLRTGRLRLPMLLHGTVNLLGSIVAPALLSRADLGALAAGRLTGGTLALLCYLGLMVAAAVVGMVLVCLRARDVRFVPAELELPRGTRAKTVFLNPGMVLFLLGTLALFVASALL